MSVYNEEVLKMADCYREIEETGTISANTIEDYKAFIEENYDVTEENILYIMQVIINIALNTGGKEILENIVDNLQIVFNNFDKAIYKSVLNIILKMRKGADLITDEELEDVSNQRTENVYLDSYLIRTLLQYALRDCNYEKIREFASELRSSNDLLENVKAKILWRGCDVEI